MKKAKIALCMIVKDDSEAEMFERCLRTFRAYVDGLYVAVTGTSGEHAKIHKLVKEFNGKSISTSPKTHPQIYAEVDGKTIFAHFGEARNVSFDMVDKKFDYLTWADVDDILTAGEELRECADISLERGWDSVFFTYWYAMKYDKAGNPTDVIITHLRERLLRAGAFKWASRLHEVAMPKEAGFRPRQSQWDLNEGRECVWVHLPGMERVDKALARNRQILEIQAREEEGKDPRTIFNLAKIHYDLGIKGDKESLVIATKLIDKYLDMSGWDAERANALEYMGLCYENLGELRKAAEAYHMATFEYPTHLLPYLRLANVYFELGMDQFASEWLSTALKKGMPEAEPTIGNPYEIKLLAASLKLKEAQRSGNDADCEYWAEKRAAIMGEDDGQLEAMREHHSVNEAARGMFTYAKWLKDSGNEKKLPSLLESVPQALGGLPFVRVISNSIEGGKKWEDNSIVYLASWMVPHFETWDWRSMEKGGVGGSETAVISLTERWAKAGYKVTVYADVPEASKSPSGVDWKPYYSFNFKDEFNTLIIWRAPVLIDMVKKAKHLYYDAHDIESQTNWTADRVRKVEKIFVKSKYHRSNIPKVPDKKVVVISNGIRL